MAKLRHARREEEQERDSICMVSDGGGVSGNGGRGDDVGHASSCLRRPCPVAVAVAVAVRLPVFYRPAYILANIRDVLKRQDASPHGHHKHSCPGFARNVLNDIPFLKKNIGRNFIIPYQQGVFKNTLSGRTVTGILTTAMTMAGCRSLMCQQKDSPVKRFIGNLHNLTTPRCRNLYAPPPSDDPVCCVMTTKRHDRNGMTVAARLRRHDNGDTVHQHDTPIR